MANELFDITGSDAPENALWVDSLDLKNTLQQWGWAHGLQSVEGKPMTMAGTVYARGIGTHAASELLVRLKGGAARFVADVGIDDETNGRGAVVFQVWVDDEKKADSGPIRAREKPRRIDVDLSGAREMTLTVLGAEASNDLCHADWGGALLLLSDPSIQPETAIFPDEPAPEIASGDGPEPAIHGPRVTGATPGHDFLFLIPATGDGPLKFSAEGLPAGLSLDSNTGIISGSIEQAGEYVATITVEGPRGRTSRQLTIIAGQHKLARTPPLGWNSWNVWASSIDDAKVRSAADAMVSSGLAAKGYQFINIDDCWEAGRAPDGEILPNEKFPDMKALSGYVHSLGLRLGIYSSPGPLTCGGHTGSYQHEHQDAKTWAKWGIDYVKHDWCSYGQIAKDGSREELMKPYIIMRDALDKCGRDITYSLCQYGMGSVWEWGAQVGANCWCTTGDITDTWHSMEEIGFSQDGHEKFAGPGHWNDPDMMVVGNLGWGPNLHPTRLTKNEQITHMTLWTLICSPILLGCDLADMDQFTVDLLTNTEVLDVHQDPLGRPAGRVWKQDAIEVWARPLWDGTIAAGLFNRGRRGTEVPALWDALGLEGPQPVRDLWLRRDLGEHTDAFRAHVPRHGAVFVRVGHPM